MDWSCYVGIAQGYWSYCYLDRLRKMYQQSSDTYIETTLIEIWRIELENLSKITIYHCVGGLYLTTWDEVQLIIWLKKQKMFQINRTKNWSMLRKQINIIYRSKYWAYSAIYLTKNKNTNIIVDSWIIPSHDELINYSTWWTKNKNTNIIVGSLIILHALGCKFVLKIVNFGSICFFILF